jgi:hypothetical protein
MSGHFLKDIPLASTTTSLAFKLPAGNRMASTCYVNSGATITKIQQSSDGTTWTDMPASFALIALSNQAFGWNISHTTAAVPPLPLIRVVGTGITSLKIAVVE